MKYKQLIIVIVIFTVITFVIRNYFDYDLPYAVMVSAGFVSWYVSQKKSHKKV